MSPSREKLVSIMSTAERRRTGYRRALGVEHADVLRQFLQVELLAGHIGGTTARLFGGVARGCDLGHELERVTADGRAAEKCQRESRYPVRTHATS